MTKKETALASVMGSGIGGMAALLILALVTLIFPPAGFSLAGATLFVFGIIGAGMLCGGTVGPLAVYISDAAKQTPTNLATSASRNATPKNATKPSLWQRIRGLFDKNPESYRININSSPTGVIPSNETPNMEKTTTYKIFRKPQSTTRGAGPAATPGKS